MGLLLILVPGLAGCGVTATPSVMPTPFAIVASGEYVWHEGEAFLPQSGSSTADLKCMSGPPRFDKSPLLVYTRIQPQGKVRVVDHPGGSFRLSVPGRNVA